MLRKELYLRVSKAFPGRRGKNYGISEGGYLSTAALPPSRRMRR